jgi:hypothetical protein
LTDNPAIDTVAVRDGPSLGATLKVTVPGPLPLLPPVMVIHGTAVVAVHVHSALLALTWTVRSPPLGSTCSAVEDSRKSQGFPSWETCIR